MTDTGTPLGPRNYLYWSIVLMALILLSQSMSINFQVTSVASIGSTVSKDSPAIRMVAGRPLAEAMTITVMVDLRAGWRDWGFSFLEANQLQLYGRYRYHVEWLHFVKESSRLERLANSSQACVVVSNPKGLEELRQAHAPNCKTWIINDEFCKYQGEIRHYFKEKSQRELFVPLGPRYDFNQAYHDRPHTRLLPTSERRFKFNAIFSKSTSPSRKILKPMLLEDPKYNASQDYFVKVSSRTQHVNLAPQLQPAHRSSDSMALATKDGLAPCQLDTICQYPGSIAIHPGSYWPQSRMLSFLGKYPDGQHPNNSAR